MTLKLALESLKSKHILVTGGAGFIGSNIVGMLLSNHIQTTVLDNLATGKLSNLKEFEGNELFQFIEGDITDFNTCLNAMKDVDVITHQAALGSVPRSIENPIN